MMLNYSPNKAYPTQEGDFIVPCRVCGKQVVMEYVGKNTYQVLFHNDRVGSPCNGSSHKALITKRIL